MMVLVVIEVDGEKRQDIVKFTRYEVCIINPARRRRENGMRKTRINSFAVITACM